MADIKRDTTNGSIDTGGARFPRGGTLLHSQWDLVHTIDDPNAFGTSYGDFFGGTSYGNAGASSAVSGDYMIVGAASEDEADGASSGKAYIFNIHTGKLAHVLDNPNDYDTPVSDNFGYFVDISGDKCVVSAHLEDIASNTASGVVYIFDVVTAELLLTIDNPNGYGTSAYDSFGEAVAIDGNNVLVGAWHEDDVGGTDSGKAYIFNATTGALLQTLNNPNDYGTSAGDRFGKNVSIDGSHCIVGAEREDILGNTSSGVAYIFTVSTGALLWTLDNPNDFGTAAYDRFGLAVSISGNYAVVGSPWEDDASFTSVGRAYVFNVTTGALLWTLDNPNDFGTTYYDNFGAKVDVTGDYALISAWYEDDASGNQSGKVYMFNVTTGASVHTFDNPNPYGTSQQDYFGGLISISDTHAIITASFEDDAGGGNAGKAYVFALDDIYETDAQSLLASVVSVGNGSGIDATTLNGKYAHNFLPPSALDNYAPLASPALTGNPTAPTQTTLDNSTKIATTAYADAASGGGYFKGNGIVSIAPVASGSSAVAIGSGADATQNLSLAIGDSASSTGGQSVALGYNVSTYAFGSICIGYSSQAKESDNICIGNQASAGITNGGSTEGDAIALGDGADAYALRSIAVGFAATAGHATITGHGYSTTMGAYGIAAAFGSTALGARCEAHGDYSLSVGYDSQAKEGYNIAIGYQAFAGQTNEGVAEQYAIAIGSNSDAYEEYSIAIGFQAVAGKQSTSTDPNAIAIGRDAKADQLDSIAMGYGAEAEGTSTIAYGRLSQAREEKCIAIGLSSQAGQTLGGTTEIDAIAIGANAKSYNIGGVALGEGAIAGTTGTSVEYYAIAIGQTAEATKIHSIAIGYTADAKGDGAIAIGGGTTTEAREDYGIAIGVDAQAGTSNGGAVEINSIAIGQGTVAQHKYSIAIGYQAKDGSTGQDYAVSIGYQAQADQDYAVSIGYQAAASLVGECQISTGPTQIDRKIIIQGDMTSASLTNIGNAPSVPTDMTWTFVIKVAAFQDTTEDAAGYKIEGCVSNKSGTTAIVGSVTIAVLGEDDAAWDCDVIASGSQLQVRFATDGTANAVNVQAIYDICQIGV